MFLVPKDECVSRTLPNAILLGAGITSRFRLLCLCRTQRSKPDQLKVIIDKVMQIKTLALDKLRNKKGRSCHKSKC
eukprot:2825920-Amphidinium_carterae.1